MRKLTALAFVALLMCPFVASAQLVSQIPWSVGYGGTGVSTLAANGILYGNDTGVVLVTAQGAANSVLTANAGAPSFSAAPTVGTSVTTPLVIGGTAAGSTLTLESTSGAGTTDAIIFTTGSQVEKMRLTNSGNLGIGMTPSHRLDIFAGDIRFTRLVPPSAPSVALAGLGAGNLSNKIYFYRVTYVNGSGESGPSSNGGPVTVTDFTTNGQVAITNISTSSDSGVTARKIYRNSATNTTDGQLVATISDNTTTTYTDNIADASLGVYLPLLGTASGSLRSATQVAALSSVLQLDEGGTNVIFNSSQNGNFSNVTTQAAILPATRRHTALMYNQGYVYSISGDDTTSGFAQVYYALLGSNGRLGAFTTDTTVLPATRTFTAHVVANGYIYIMGGSSNATIANAQTTVYFAKPNLNGSLQAFSTTTALPVAIVAAKAVYYNGYIYVMGGLDAASAGVTSIYYTKVNADGTLGAWLTATNTLPVGVGFHGAAVVHDFLYVYGGKTGSASSTGVATVYYSRIGADFSPGAWSTSANSLPVANHDQCSYTLNGHIYAAGGTNTAGTNTSVEYFTTIGTTGFTTTGDVAAWTAVTIPSNTGNAGQCQSAVSEGSLFKLFSGVNFWLTFPPAIYVVGDLDLLSRTTQIRSTEGTIGGKIQVGDIHVAGGARVLGPTLLRGDVRLFNTFNVSPPAAPAVTTGTGISAGTTVSLVAAAGGADSSTGNVAAGLGGIMSITAGIGGAETGASGTNTGGAGGTLELLGGGGGAATSGTGGAGGNIYITGGAVGTGSTGTPVAGYVVLGKTNAGVAQGRVGIGLALPTGLLEVADTATTGTVIPAVVVTNAAHTALTAGTERFDTNFNSARTVQWNTNALTTQRFNLFQAPTIGFVGGSTVTDTCTLCVTGAPVKGTNATLSNTHGLLIQAGAVSTAAAAFGITANAPTGATLNYAGQFIGQVLLGSVAFASLGAPANGTITFCSNCDPPTLVDSTCTSAGAATGSFAVRVNSLWKCIS